MLPKKIKIERFVKPSYRIWKNKTVNRADCAEKSC